MRNCLIIFAIIFSPLLAVVHKRSAASKCRDKMDKGSPCPNGKKAQLSWFFDIETNVCLSFKYNGCGGNSNRFDSIELCEMNCLPPGFGTCALNEEPFKNSNGQQRICSGPEVEECPADYICKHLASFGVCCPKKSEELFAKNYAAACSSGKTVKVERRGRKSNLLGKSCEDDFCPANSSCVQEGIFAHCCD